MKMIAALVVSLMTFAVHADELDVQLRDMINSTSKFCPMVIEKFYNGSSAEGRFLSVRCSNGESFMVMVSKQSARVAPCDSMKVANVQCFVKF